jgi:two-component system, NarL family, response regulator DevR
MHEDDHRRGGAVSAFVLDDHELLRRGLRDVLSAQPDITVVGESGSAREAARRIPALHPDVMLLDVQLPDGSGIEVCRHVRSVDPRIRGLVVTTYDDDQARLAAALAGASGFVLKQIRSGELVAAVRAVARGAVLLDEAEVRATIEVAHRRRPAVARLTVQEHRVLQLIAQGMTNRQIGQQLGIREKTVKNYITSLLLKLGLQRRTQAAVLALQHRDGAGVVDPSSFRPDELG